MNCCHCCSSQNGSALVALPCPTPNPYPFSIKLQLPPSASSSLLSHFFPPSIPLHSPLLCLLCFCASLSCLPQFLIPSPCLPHPIASGSYRVLATPSAALQLHLQLQVGPGQPHLAALAMAMVSVLAYVTRVRWLIDPAYWHCYCATPPPSPLSAYPRYTP